MSAKLRNTCFFILVNICLINSQTNDSLPPARYLIDSLEFTKLCKPEYRFEYFQVAGKNDKSSDQILKELKAVFVPPKNFKQSGFLTIKFIVNCHKELCCFHVFEMDETYQPIEFDAGVKAQLIAFIKILNGWKSAEYEGKSTNYRYYLNFVIKNGEFKRVSP
jgi:hypothetical protein